MDTPVLDGLPRDWPHDMAPGRDRDPHIQKAAPSPTRVDRHSSTPDIVEKASPFKLEAEPEPEPSVALRLDTTESLLPEGGPLQTSSAQEGPPSPPRSSRVLSKLDDPFFHWFFPLFGGRFVFAHVYYRQFRISYSCYVFFFPDSFVHQINVRCR